MRGKETGTSMKQQDQRITPAYAGKRSAMESPVYPSRDHPRLCGEKSLQKRSVMWRAGSPPPMRGKGKRIHGINTECGITPAYAGKRFSHLAFFLQSWDHPRLCGEKGNTVHWCETLKGSPPPMRGKECRELYDRLCGGITPAYAGKSSISRDSLTTLKDHPRLCGEKPRL